ncbi:hypothetical protein ADL21_11990 [Streptomyces albus subsp. albus]|nr:hypothetical protein ADL21_11990 [Streptomyces albus subsp. albus]
MGNAARSPPAVPLPLVVAPRCVACPWLAHEFMNDGEPMTMMPPAAAGVADASPLPMVAAAMASAVTALRVVMPYER